MPRPTRYDRPTRRRTIFVSVETSAAIDSWCAGGHGRTPGMLVDDLVRRTLRAQVPPEASGSGARIVTWEGSLASEGWTVDPVSGEFVPPAYLTPEKARERWRQEIAATQPGPAQVFRPHKEIRGATGASLCTNCHTLRSDSARWILSCPGPKEN